MSDDLSPPLERVPMAAEETSSKCRAQIVGKVEFRQGEGILFAIPLGAADVEVTALDTTFSWTEGNFHAVAAMPFVDFCRYLTEGAINLDECSASADMQLHGRDILLAAAGATIWKPRVAALT